MPAGGIAVDEALVGSAIDKDETAPTFQIADDGLVGDGFPVLPQAPR